MLPFNRPTQKAGKVRQEETQQRMKLKCHQFWRSEEIISKETYKSMELPRGTTEANGTNLRDDRETLQQPGKASAALTQVLEAEIFIPQERPCGS